MPKFCPPAKSTILVKTVFISHDTENAAVAELPTHALSSGPCSLEVLGHDPGGQGLYLLERLPGRVLPALYIMTTGGRLAGRMLPVRSMYDGDPAEVATQVPRRIAELRERLVALKPVSAERWRLGTRVLHCRAEKRAPTEQPLRTFELELAIEPAKSKIDLGARAAVRAYLRPSARLDKVLIAASDEFGVGIVSYIGVPCEIGYERQAAVLIPPRRNRPRTAEPVSI